MWSESISSRRVSKRRGGGEEEGIEDKGRGVDSQGGEGRGGKGRRTDTVCEIRYQAYKYIFILFLLQWFLFYYVIKLL